MWTYLCVEKQCGQITVLVLPILTIKAHKVPLQVVLLARAVCPFYGGALLCERVRKCMHLCLYSHTCARARACVCVCALVFGVKGRGERLVSNVYSSIVSMKQHIKARKDGWMAGPWRLAKTSAFAYIATQEHHLACLAR